MTDEIDPIEDLIFRINHAPRRTDFDFDDAPDQYRLVMFEEDRRILRAALELYQQGADPEEFLRWRSL